MAWQFNPYASMGYAGMLAAWGMAAAVLASAPTTRQARILPFLLLIEGFGTAGGFAIMWSTPDLDNSYAWQIIGMTSGLAGAGLYLLFISTLETPLARVFRPKAVQAGVVVATLAGCAWMTATPELLIDRMIPVWWAPWEPIPGPLWNVVFITIGVVSLYALAASIDARRRTPPGSDARHRATLYATAFGVRDILYGILYFTGPFWFQRVQPWSDLTVILVLPAVALLFSLLLGYGVLRAQLFDIDVRLRWGVKRGTLAGVFLAVFFIVATITENYLSDTLGLLAGGAAAGLLLFAASPLQRVAERVADATIPASKTTHEYLAFRKLEVYKAAVESAAETGGLTSKERAALHRLREKLGLSPADADAIERDVGVLAA